jgi:hypothetical protein
MIFVAKLPSGVYTQDNYWDDFHGVGERFARRDEQRRAVADAGKGRCCNTL